MYNCICRADIKAKNFNHKKILIILGIIFIVYALLVCIPIKKTVLSWSNNYYYDNIFNWPVKTKYDNYIPNYLLVGLGVVIGLYLIMLMIKAAEKAILKLCSLYLTNKEIKGIRKYIFLKKDLTFPIEKVDSIMVVNSTFDKIRGGKTIAIRTTSGLIKFPWVHNAEEFVNKTLDTIKAYNESSKPVTENFQQNTGGDNLEQIQKLKEMLDSDIITQDEFDTKKKQLLGL